MSYTICGHFYDRVGTMVMC